MTFSGYITRSVKTPNQSSRQSAKITTIVLHHMASTNFAGVLRMWTDAKRVGSANYAISNWGEIVGVVPEEYRSWSLGTVSDGGKGAAFDRHSITFEIENKALGSPWPVSDAAQEATVKVVADLCRRYNIPCNRTQILGHREVWTRYRASYATACPGGLDIDWIVKRAAEVLNGTHPASVGGGSTVTASNPHDAVGSNLTSRPTKDIQKLVGVIPDGIYGPDTTANVKVWQKAHGLAADGIWGPKSDAVGFPKRQSAPPRFPLPTGSYFGPEGGPVKSVSGWHGHHYDVKRLQQRLKDLGYTVVVDGYYSARGVKSSADSITGRAVRALQRDKHLVVDGLCGLIAWSAAWEKG